ncbi:hypothetical protein [Gaetbulibacter sp. PBL-D1]
MDYFKIEIEHKNGRWLTNGKPYEALSLKEKKFMDDFFREVKLKSINQ